MTIKLNAATGGGSVSLSAPNSTTSNLDVELTLPVDDGAADTFLKSDGAGTLSWASASSDSITEGNTTVECVDTGSNGHITFDTEGSERARFDSSGRLLIGTSTSIVGGNDGLQTAGTTGNQLGVGKFSNDTRGPYLNFYKSRGGLSSHGLVSSGDEAGHIYFNGSDSTYYRSCASIEAWIDSTATTGGAMPGRLIFSTTNTGATNPTERMRINSSGEVMIGHSSAISGFQFLSIRVASGQNGASFEGDSDAGRSMITFRNTNGEVGYISTSGSSTGYSTSSDYRLKENVVAVSDGIVRLKQLQPSRFNFIADPDKTVDGFIAHEVQDVVPEAIFGEKDAVKVWQEGEELPDGVSIGDNKLDEDGNTIPVYQGIDQSKLVPLLTAALQEAIGKIEALEAANASLEARLTALEGGAS